MNFDKEIALLGQAERLLDQAERILENAQEIVSKRFVIEVKKMLAKYKKYNYGFTCGNGTLFFSRDGVIVHQDQEEKLPKDMKELCTFLEDHDYIQKYVSTIKLGESNES